MSALTTFAHSYNKCNSECHAMFMMGTFTLFKFGFGIAIESYGEDNDVSVGKQFLVKIFLLILYILHHCVTGPNACNT